MPEGNSRLPSIGLRGPDPEVIEGITHVDATWLRKHRMREQSGSRGPSGWSDNARDAANVAPAEKPSAATIPAAASHSAAAVREVDEFRASEAALEPGSAALSSAELDAFLVNFVVEQTGYPAEIVEMNADLEADLGIDSIKKAQLFGELREHFDITPSDDLSLDDFPTLAHVQDYLQSAISGGTAGERAFGAGQGEGRAESREPASTASVSSPIDVAPTANGQSELTSSLSPDELEAFLVNFVVEQTGYPAEIVEMNADLEADLGIDSIKKAQLFGELREHFDVTPSDDLSLDDFPTLGDVRDYLMTAIR